MSGLKQNSVQDALYFCVLHFPFACDGLDSHLKALSTLEVAAGVSVKMTNELLVHLELLLQVCAETGSCHISGC